MRCSAERTASTRSDASLPMRRARLRRGGWLVLEIGADQGPAVADLFTDLGYRDVEIRPDLADRDRVVAVGALARLSRTGRRSR